MDEKSAYKFDKLGRPAHATMRPYARPTRRLRPLLITALVVLCFYYYVRPATPFGILPQVARLASAHDADVQKAMAASTKTLVPFEAHIMSKCPDARDCLRMLILPTMQRVFDKVNFTLSYIGTPTANDGVDCKHGPEECLGNIMLLCAASLYPDPKIYLGFSMCLIKDYEDIPQRSLIEDCALEHAIDFEKLSDCADQDDGAFGLDMLRSSVRRSAEAGVTKSCTVRVNEEIYCIRDDGEWSDCPRGPEVNDLVLEIEKQYRSS
ncbi:hypothetical protein M406DRAFT_321575 [Cryphonectria parasitica EP155]|uniref:Gamma interferon inducible lysosomal thiol reductase n=1 Tax=Cryphonectria parasitica (strain ATCC 38755 / EP155) TaxID=660469 RepID=A0A9P4Y5Q4_CRYP1|nr:uncharacterized protein M406DRAFT_321575 [Cryphonectria parasitica EP155]KAF3767454.1 hypothetical protein M406DRAFT_321575 [Cryphonectria parasitica EP155]